MAKSMSKVRIRFIGLMVFVLSISVRSVVSSSSSSSICPHESLLWLNSLHFQCPVSYPSNPPLEVDGHFLERSLTSKQNNMYSSILFYASWCPFSRNARSTFEVLSSMFPQIEHFAVEQSLVMPSIFSRYGTHSLPSILMVNQTSTVRFHGNKNLQSLVKFYKETSGLEPIHYFTKEHLFSYESSKQLVTPSLRGSSMKDIATRDPYLIFSVLFICLKMLLLVLPKATAFLQAIWVSYSPHLNLHIFGETSQMVVRLLHVTNINRLWTKVRLCKARNFHESARNARVWASSLASVSVGETSSARSSSSSSS